MRCCSWIRVTRGSSRIARRRDGCEQIGVVTHIVATKIDKLTRSERARNLKTIGDTFGTAALPVSVASGEGLDELWRMIVSIGKDADRHE